MISKYDTFLNESKVSEFTIGCRVIFKGKYRDNFGNNLMDMNDKTGVLINIKKRYYSSDYTFKLDEPIIKNIENKKFFYPYTNVKTSTVDTFTLSSLQLKNVIISNPENDEKLKKIESKEIFPFKASKVLSHILKQMKFKLANDYFDASFFDIVKDDNNLISFIPSKKIGDDDSEKFRTVSRVGRVLKKLNPNLAESEIEKFVDLYKSEYDNYFKESIVEVVTGDKIPYWYLETRYAKGSSTLNKSCMRGVYNQDRLKFYSQFPDRIAMAIIVKNGKLYARAIIWKLDNGKIYMDRIYSVSGQYSNQMKKFAIENNMLIYGNLGLDGMRITLPKYTGDTPYFDTFHMKKTDDNTILVYR